MNKHIAEGVAVCLALCAGFHKAEAGVQAYGRQNMSAERMKSSAQIAGGGATSTRLSNNRSVFGFGGSEGLGAGLQGLPGRGVAPG